MEKKLSVIIINDDYIESLIDQNDFESFEEYIHEESLIDMEEYEFDTEGEMIAFLQGVFRGYDERSPCGKVALTSNNDYNKRYIEVLKTI